MERMLGSTSREHIRTLFLSQLVRRKAMNAKKERKTDQHCVRFDNGLKKIYEEYDE